VPVAFQQSCVFIFNEMVKDRENKMKESLKIMGLNKYMYALAYLLQRMMWATLTTLLMTMMTFTLNADSISFGQAMKLFLAVWLLAVDMLGVSLVLQNFFSDSKLAAICAPFALFLPTGVAMLGIIQPAVNGSPNNWVQYLFWIPTFPFEVVLTSIFQPNTVEFFFQESPAWAWTALVLLTPLYFLLHIYLEAIIPNAYGINSPCCFCLRRKRSDDDSEVEEFDANAVQNLKRSTILNDDEGAALMDNTVGNKLISGTQLRRSSARRQSESLKSFSPSDPIQLQ